MAQDTKLHTREPVETSDANCPIDRYAVPGGWLYHARIFNDANMDAGVALCFVPTPISPANVDGQFAAARQAMAKHNVAIDQEPTR